MRFRNKQSAPPIKIPPKPEFLFLYQYKKVPFHLRVPVHTKPPPKSIVEVDTIKG